MSTSHSPLRKLKAEADRCAAKLKSMERGEAVENDPSGKVAAALAGPLWNIQARAVRKAIRENLA